MFATLVKRKRDDVDDDDLDEELSFGRQALPVANLPDDFDGVPADGLEYLFMVRRDSKQLPHVTRVANPYERPQPSSPSPVVKSFSTLLPSPEWRAQLEMRFRNFRRNTVQPTIHVQLDNQRNRKLMPDKKERDFWWEFLSGKPESDWNPPKKLKQNAAKRRKGMYAFSEDIHPTYDVAEESAIQETWRVNEDGDVVLVPPTEATNILPTPLCSPEPSETTPLLQAAENSVTGNGALPRPREPTPKLLRAIDERMALHLLMYFAHWINLYLQQPDDSSFLPTQSHARWMFSLLARVEDQISGDDMSLLRNLARTCLSLLKMLVQKRLTPSTIPPEVDSLKDGILPMSERCCWIIISIIIGVWGQRDLWIDAEEMLAGSSEIHNS